MCYAHKSKWMPKFFAITGAEGVGATTLAGGRSPTAQVQSAASPGKKIPISRPADSSESDPCTRFSVSNVP